MPNIIPIPAFDDNYIWCMHDGDRALVVDPGDASAVEDALAKHGLKLEAILITHHHYDHTGGIIELAKAHSNLAVYGPNNHKIKGITHSLSEGDSVSFESPRVSFKIMETPGHTMDHIVYYNDELIFCGDTLFSAGCGRMFEGSPEIFHHSLEKIASLPGNTKVYCTHEYTQANVAFAQHVEPANRELKAYADWVFKKRAKSEITLPTDIKTQKAINPFLRCAQESTKKNIETIMNLSASNSVEVFAALRSCKDNF